MTKFNYEEFERRLPTNLDYQFATTGKITLEGQERLKKQLLIKVDGYSIKYSLRMNCLIYSII